MYFPAMTSAPGTGSPNGCNAKNRWITTGVARVTRRWEPYAGMVYFHMLLEGLCEAGELK